MISFLRISSNISSLEASRYINNINVCSEVNVSTYLQSEGYPAVSFVYFEGHCKEVYCNHLFSSVSKDDLEVAGAFY